MRIEVITGEISCFSFFISVAGFYEEVFESDWNLFSVMQGGQKSGGRGIKKEAFPGKRLRHALVTSYPFYGSVIADLFLIFSFRFADV
jgi:hypothetical protein